MKRVKKTIVIDDDPIFTFLLERMLQKLDFTEELVVFHESDTALSAIEDCIDSPEHLPDVLFIDINMPILDGFDLLRQIRERITVKKILIYMISSTCDPMDFKKMETHPEIAEFLMKPVSVETLQTLKSRTLAILSQS